MTKTPSRSSDRKTILDAQTAVELSMMAWGDTLAKKQGYKSLDGLDACHYYLMIKHNWLPREVMTMTPRELEFALLSELEG
jgi:hypothetical protein